MIKSLLVAAAVAVLSLSGGGVALASSSVPADNNSSNCSALNVQLNVLKAASPRDEAAITLLELKIKNECSPGHNGGSSTHPSWPNNPGHNNGGPRGGTYHGPVYDNCSDYNRNGVRDIRRGDSRYLDRLDRDRDGVACDGGDVVIVDSSGDCTTYAVARDSIRTYSNDYNRLRTQYRGDWNRVSNSDRLRLNQYYSASRRYASSYDSTRLSNLRTICKDTSPTVTIVNEAPPAPVVVQAPASNPVPYGSSGGQVSSKPSDGAETGDGSKKIS